MNALTVPVAARMAEEAYGLVMRGWTSPYGPCIPCSRLIRDTLKKMGRQARTIQVRTEIKGIGLDMGGQKEFLLDPEACSKHLACECDGIVIDAAIPFWSPPNKLMPPAVFRAGKRFCSRRTQGVRLGKHLARYTLMDESARFAERDDWPEIRGWSSDIMLALGGTR